MKAITIPFVRGGGGFRLVEYVELSGRSDLEELEDWQLEQLLVRFGTPDELQAKYRKL